MVLDSPQLVQGNRNSIILLGQIAPLRVESSLRLVIKTS